VAGLMPTLGPCAAIAIGLALAATPASAADNDFRLNSTRNGDGILFSGSMPNTARWERFITELGYVFSPRLASPAETLGHAGFQISGLWSGTFVSNDEESGYWFVTEAGQRGQPIGLLHTLQLDLRKGLPFSFELGANLVWLVESELFSPGLEVRWTVQEGYRLAPDFGVRGSVSHMLGSRDMNLTVVGLDAVISKGFGLAGMVHVAPYLSWSLLLVAASSRVVDPTPTREDDIGNNFVFPEVVAGENIHHKLTLGVRALFSLLNLSVQSEFEMLEKTPTGRSFFGSVATIGVKLGLEY
jgi:hypothetical protein